MGMTGYTVHTGASKKFVSGWDRVFGDGKSAKKAGAAQPISGGKAKSGGRSAKKSAAAKGRKKSS